MQLYNFNHLRDLEAESIYIIRETAAQFERPALLFSGGKDSIVMSHMARKAFYPAKIPFPCVHIDTGHNFPETIEYRDMWMKEIGANLIVGHVQKLCLIRAGLRKKRGKCVAKCFANRNITRYHCGKQI